MKKNQDTHFDKLFNGLINPNVNPSGDEIQEAVPERVVEALISKPPTSVTQPQTSNHSTSAPPGRRKPGRKKTNKVSFMARLSEDKVEKLSWLAARFGIHKCDIIEEGLTYYLNKYEEKHGTIDPSSHQTAADLIM